MICRLDPQCPPMLPYLSWPPARGISRQPSQRGALHPHPPIQRLMGAQIWRADKTLRTRKRLHHFFCGGWAQTHSPFTQHLNARADAHAPRTTQAHHFLVILCTDQTLAAIYSFRASASRTASSIRDFTTSPIETSPITRPFSTTGK